VRLACRGLWSRGSLNGTLARTAIQTVTQASEASAKSFIVRSQRSEALLPLSAIRERALKLSSNPRVTNSSRALASLRLAAFKLPVASFSYRERAIWNFVSSTSALDSLQFDLN
jgi:hypothetical protein